MTDAGGPPLDPLAEAAARLGIEHDRAETARWMAEISRAGRATLAEDPAAGVFGHPLSLADFDAADLPVFRALAAHVRAEPRPAFESALAIAGSAAQGRIQPFPGDCDFYERVHLRAASLAEARAILADVVLATARRVIAAPDAVLVEVNFGVYPCAVTERGVARDPGDPITWLSSDILAGHIDVTAGGSPLQLPWHAVEAGAGWTYVGTLAADRASGRVVLASNMIDATWESPAGTIVALDGTIDACFQEVYLDAAARPLVRRLIAAVDPSTAFYAEMMRRQARHYAHEACDFCKASKRLYNLFRVTGDLESAAWVRELFDEPAMCLYQAPGMLEAIEIAMDDGQKVDRSLIVLTLERVRDAVAAGIPGAGGDELTLELQRVGEVVECGSPLDGPCRDAIARVRRRCGAHVSEYVRSRLLGLPRIASFVDGLRERG